MEVPRLGVELEHMPQPQPHPQPRQIRTSSVTYTTAHGNTRFLTHWERPGIEPASSWIRVRFISAEPRWELQTLLSYGIGFPL